MQMPFVQYSFSSEENSYFSSLYTENAKSLLITLYSSLYFISNS